MSTALDVDVASLTELDFPVPCGHSQHGKSDKHRGDATHVAVAFHSCLDDAGPTIYPCCDSWARFVLQATAEGKSMICTRCGTLGLWSEMVAIVSTLS